MNIDESESDSGSEVSSDLEGGDEITVTDEEVIGDFEEVQEDNHGVHENDQEESKNNRKESESNENFFDSYSYPQWKETCTSNVDIKALAMWIMFKSSNISVLQVLNMITAITIRFSLSDEAQQAILQLIKILAGPDFQFLDVSKYTISKQFNPSANAVLHVFYCESCCIPVTEPITRYQMKKKKSTKCPKCEKKYKVSTSEENFFISLNMEYQIKTLLSDKSIRSMIDNELKKQNEKSENHIRDICDSDRYIDDNYIASKKLNGDIVLTLNVNLDGAPLFKSSQHSFWPIQCVINEIPISFRHKIVLLGGLWYTSVEPTPAFMDLYLRIFIMQISKLMNKGVEIMTENEVFKKYYFKIFSFPVDSVARPILQNRLQFNGKFGCSWCYQQSVYKSRSMRYLFTETIPEERTHDKYLEDVKTLRASYKKLPKTKKNENYTVKGVKGPSVLPSLPNFDCIWGFPHDYMHAVLLGVSRQLWNFWSKWHLNVEDRKEINRRLLEIRPPSEIHRVPRALKNKQLWKATEWRSWLLFYSVPVLTDILDDELLDSYKLLVRSIQKLLSQNLSEDDLLASEIDLLKFIHDCQQFYGDSFMTFNIHSLRHIVQSVRKNGPSSNNSAYIFENNIYNLKKKVTSPKGVSNQMSSRCLRDNMFRSQLPTAPNDITWQFCKTILDRSKEITNCTRTSDGALLVDNDVQDFMLEEEQIYSRCIYKSVMFHGTLYTKNNKTNNTIVNLDNNKIAKIHCFYQRNNKAYVKVTVATVEKFDILEHIFVVKKWENEFTVIRIEEIVSKMVFISVKNLSSTSMTDYVCLQPNSFEVQ